MVDVAFARGHVEAVALVADGFVKVNCQTCRLNYRGNPEFRSSVRSVVCDRGGMTVLNGMLAGPFCSDRRPVPGEVAAGQRERAIVRLAERLGWARTCSRARAAGPAEAFLRENAHLWRLQAIPPAEGAPAPGRRPGRP